MRENEFAHLYFFTPVKTHLVIETILRTMGIIKSPNPVTQMKHRGGKTLEKRKKRHEKHMKCNMKAAFKGRVMACELGDAGETVGQSRDVINALSRFTPPTETLIPMRVVSVGNIF